MMYTHSLVLLHAGFWLLSFAHVAPDRRIDCAPKPGANKLDCESNRCIWDDGFNEDSTVPMCYFPSETGYMITESSASHLKLIESHGGGKNPFGSNISPIEVDIANLGSVLGIRIGPKYRSEPTIELPKNAINSDEKFDIVFTEPTKLFSFTIRRKRTNGLIWNTSIGGLLFADRFIQIATYLPTDKIYGFGEHVHPNLKHSFSSYTTWPMFARDQPPDPANKLNNLYGVHPFYLAIENDMNAHGVFFPNLNAQEVTTGPAPHLIYKTIGGDLEIFFFPGPTPEQVIQQYLNFIGKPFLPAYFALGFQFCRYGYKNLDDLKSTIWRIRSSGIPLEVVFADIDYMQRYKDFTIDDIYWSGFDLYAQSLHQDNLHLFLIFDPAIQVDDDAFRRALEQNASFIEWERADQVPLDIQAQYPLVNNTQIMLGVVWPDKHVAFPDFLDPTGQTQKWWISEFQRFHEIIPFDGIWIDMNEPAVFGTNELHPFYYDDPERPVKIKPLMCPLDGSQSRYETPPYATWAVYQYNQAYLSSKTLCMSAMTGRRTKRFYDTKNVYGLAETITTNLAHRQAIGKRGAIISRSTFASSGHYGGHWLGDNAAQWSDLRASIIGIQEFNLFGIPYIGADVCGFNGNTTEELCLRWHQLGAFYPFFRNHNERVAANQEPSKWPSVANAARQAILFRYYYLPYLYSLLFSASLSGGTVVRPVFFEFIHETETHTLDEQFMWGNAMMIIPVTIQGADTVSGYLPHNSSWYSIRESDYAIAAKSGRNIFSAPKNDLLPIFVRGGTIVPRQKPESTTAASRLNPLEILIAMTSGENGEAHANGTLFWDDGETIVNDFQTYNYYHWHFQFLCTTQHASLYITSLRDCANLSVPSLDIIDIIGYHYQANLNVASLNGRPAKIDFHSSFYDSSKKRLLIKSNNFLNISKIQKITLTWPHTTLA